MLVDHIEEIREYVESQNTSSEDETRVNYEFNGCYQLVHTIENSGQVMFEGYARIPTNKADIPEYKKLKESIEKLMDEILPENVRRSVRQLDHSLLLNISRIFLSEEEHNAEREGIIGMHGGPTRVEERYDSYRLKV